MNRLIERVSAVSAQIVAGIVILVIFTLATALVVLMGVLLIPHNAVKIVHWMLDKALGALAAIVVFLEELI